MHRLADVPIAFTVVHMHSPSIVVYLIFLVTGDVSYEIYNNLALKSRQFPLGFLMALL